MSTRLKQLLELYDEHYYNKDDSLVSDAEYDSLKKVYLLQQGVENYSHVSGKATTGERIRHNNPVLSLKDIQAEDTDSIRKEVERLGYPVTVQPKYDGLTVVFSNGRVATRGDGEEGEDITDNVMNVVDGVDKILKSGLDVRGEALIMKQDFNRINNERLKEGEEPFKNARNTASGVLRRKDIEDFEGITIFLYDIMGSKLSVEEKVAVLESFNSENLRATSTVRIDDDETLEEFIEGLNRDNLDDLPFEVDGVVVKSDKRDSIGKFGLTGHHPKDSFAIKFPVEGVWTTIESITHQVGRTGKIVPVAELSPVDILGSTVSRATLHNESYVNAMNLDILYKGTQAKIIKANEIIPAIIETNIINKDTIVGSGVIKRCPVCSSELKYINEQQFCLNANCEAKSKLRAEHLAKRECLDINGLSTATVEKMFNSIRGQEYLHNPFEILNITKEEILDLEGFADKSAQNLFDSINNAKKKVKLNNFITSLGINEVGKGTSKLISEKLLTYDNFISDLENNCDIIKTIDGIGPVVIDNLLENIDVAKSFRTYIGEVISLEDKETTDDKKKVCISGKFDISKKEIENLLIEKGYEVINSVTKDCDILLSKGNTSSKYKKAVENNITIVDDYKALI